jgi:hypothetical protein
MQDFFGRHICRFGVFIGGERPEMRYDASGADARDKFAFSFRHPQSTSFITAMRSHLVLNVFGRCNVPQIYQSVIVRNTVNVVNIVFRPLAVRIKPYQAMRSVTPTVKSYDAVTVVVYSPCHASYYYSPIGFYAPTQNPTFTVIIKQFFNTILRKHVFAPMVFSYSATSFVSRMKAP